MILEPPLAARQALPDLLQHQRVTCRIGKRYERRVRATLRVWPGHSAGRGPAEPSSVEHFADIHAARDEIRPRRMDVLHYQHESPSRTRCRVLDALAKDD